ncbi:MAG TPA: NADH-quinone oxidoreductase subunit A [Verrucomicrobiae bacterium]|jgi:NADH-quinone oxidoreductase subunit A|nr:NADH-quinone oxidoreductase subunit A [Verrucomicrobiae bacterium]
MHSDSWSFLALFALAAVGFALAPLIIAWVWARAYSPRKPGAIKNATYECGLASEGTGWIQFQSDIYLYGIVFLVFDVETIFLMPVAAAFQGLSFGACAAMSVFMLLLVEGLVWLWLKGALGSRTKYCYGTGN